MREIQYLQVPAVFNGTSFVLVNENGSPISKEIIATDIGPLNRDTEIKAVWSQWVKQALAKINTEIQRYIANQNDWTRKVNSLACSFRIRAKRRSPRKANITYSDKRSLQSWMLACERMQRQANTRNYHASLDPWRKWALCVSGNANKRGANHG